MHVVQLDDSRVEVSEETRPVVLEVLCDECESALKFSLVPSPFAVSFSSPTFIRTD
jgi:hypothetical protein